MVQGYNYVVINICLLSAVCWLQLCYWILLSLTLLCGDVMSSSISTSWVHRRPIETNGATIPLSLRCFWETQPWTRVKCWGTCSSMYNFYICLLCKLLPIFRGMTYNVYFMKPWVSPYQGAFFILLFRDYLHLLVLQNHQLSIFILFCFNYSGQPRFIAQPITYFDIGF